MPTLLICARIAEDVYHDRPTTVHRYEPVMVPQQESFCGGHEFAGGAYAGVDGVGVIAFRGSRELEDWKGANFDILRRRMPERQVGSALAFFAPAHRALARAGCTRYLVIGHSLGGALAAVVAAAVTWVPVKGVTFNAPGLAEFTGSAGGSGFDLGQPNADNVTNFRARDDVVSRWGRAIGKVYDIPSAGRHGISAFIACLDATRFGDMKF